jgi:hypothetical protein
MTTKTSRTQRLLATGAVVLGVGLGAAGIASAASGGAATTTTRPGAGPPDPGAQIPATLAHGPGETQLTGTDLANAAAAANSEVPGATIVRAETDSAGSAFEVHMKKADGSYVTVKLDSTFSVTAVDDGFGAGPMGRPPVPVGSLESAA